VSPIRRLAVVVLLAGVVAAACAGPVATSFPPVAPALTPVPAATPTPSPAPSTPGASPSATVPATPSGIPAPTPAPSPVPTTIPEPSPSPTAIPTPAGPTADDFWALVRRGVVSAGSLEVAIGGSDATLRFEPTASATAIDGVVGFVCMNRRAYDGQSGFTALPGTWTCGPGALSAGFRAIGQPADAWNDDIPTDRARRESVVGDDSIWTWRYGATSPYVRGEVTASVTVDRATGRVTAARRTDPTAVTRYTFRYGADFPPIKVPR